MYKFFWLKKIFFVHSYYNTNMTNEKLKSMLKEIYEPFIDQLIDITMTFATAIESSLPKDMPEEQKVKMVKDILDAQVKGMQEGMKKVVPEDITKQLKEALDGRK